MCPATTAGATGVGGRLLARAAGLREGPRLGRPALPKLRQRAVLGKRPSMSECSYVNNHEYARGVNSYQLNSYPRPVAGGPAPAPAGFPGAKSRWRLRAQLVGSRARQVHTGLVTDLKGSRVCLCGPYRGLMAFDGFTWRRRMLLMHQGREEVVLYPSAGRSSRVGALFAHRYSYEQRRKSGQGSRACNKQLSEHLCGLKCYMLYWVFLWGIFFVWFGF